MKLATDIHRVSGTLLKSRYKMKVVTTQVIYKEGGNAYILR